MTYRSADGLDKFKQHGSRFLPEEWNAAARAVSGDKTIGRGASDESSLALAHRRQGRRWIKALCTQEVLPYSAVIIAFNSTSGGGTAHPVQVAPFSVRKWNTIEEQPPKNSWGTILTNGGTHHIPASGGGNDYIDLHVVDPITPTLLRVVDSLAPAVGGFAGLYSGGDGRVCGGKTGLIALSNVHTPSQGPTSGYKLQWFLATRGPLAIVGPGSASAATSSAFGVGTLRPKNRVDGFSTILPLTNNETYAVWNPYQQALTSGNLVAVDVPGVGFVIAGYPPPTTPPPANETCKILGTFVTEVDFNAGTTTKKKVTLCIDWDAKNFTVFHEDA